ncbi:MAG TPA: TIR domain-containing protein [Thermoanaerobaculia bacterium]
MANPEHVAKLKEGEGAWNAWRRTSDEIPDLSNIVLVDVSLDYYDLTSVNLSGSQLSSVTFQDTSCRATSFERAVIVHGHFSDAILNQSNFRDASIESTTFEWSDMEESNFTDASFIANSFAHVSLRDAQGLDTIKETGTTSIGIDTFFNSGGLPDSFLRGSGVPEEFIQYAASLVGKAIEYYSCFLSYSSQDDEFARRLYNDLQGKKVRTWYAPEDLKIGDRFRSRIDESIRIHDKLVLILSANSVASDWVESEVESALERERKEGMEVLFPIAIDDEGLTSQQPWASDIRHKRHIGDFRKWKSHDDYTNAFDRLVRDLKKSQPPIIMKGG